MSSDLIIGSLDSDIWEHLARICKRNGMAMPAAYAGDADDRLPISLFNLASICLFNDYAAGLEGFHGPDAMTKTTFRNLPWWMEAFWLPLDFDPPIVENHFIGSSVRLLQELAKIRNMSAIDLAALPPGYMDMRTDYTTWFKRENERLSDDDVIRWVWNALHEGARISIEQNMPVMLAP
jgi:hypothetical protein